MTTNPDRPALPGTGVPALLGPFEGMRKSKRLGLKECIIVLILAIIVVGLIVYHRCTQPQEENAPTVRPRAPRRTASTGEPWPRTVKTGSQQTIDVHNAPGAPDPLLWTLDVVDSGGIPSGPNCRFPRYLPTWPGAQAAGIE